MKVGVLGAGGAGGYFAARWAESGLEVALVARGPHLEVIRERGLRVASPRGDVTVSVEASDDPAVLAGSDVVVVATKTWQLPDAVSAARAHLGESVVFGLQNGVESPEVLGDLHRPDRVLGATCRIISFVEGPGRIRHLGVAPTIVLGELDGRDSARARELASRLDVPDRAAVSVSDHIVVDLWRKFLFFAPVSGVGSVTRSPIGSFRGPPPTRRLLEAAIREVAAVGARLDVPLGDVDVDSALDFIDRLPADGTSSMQRDFAEGRRTELEALSGYLSRAGKRLDVPTPAHDFIYAALLPLELAARTGEG